MLSLSKYIDQTNICFENH